MKKTTKNIYTFEHECTKSRVAYLQGELDKLNDKAEALEHKGSRSNQLHKEIAYYAHQLELAIKLEARARKRARYE